MVTCEIELFENYFSLRRRPSKTIFFQRAEPCMKLFHNYFTGLLQLMDIFQHVHCRRNNFRTLSAAEIIVFQFQTWLHMKKNTEILLKLFWCSITHVTTVGMVTCEVKH